MSYSIIIIVSLAVKVEAAATSDIVTRRNQYVASVHSPGQKFKYRLNKL